MTRQERSDAMAEAAGELALAVAIFAGMWGIITLAFLGLG